MELSNKFVDKFWENMIVIKFFIFMFMVAIFCSCGSTKEVGDIPTDVKYHMTFNRVVQRHDTLVTTERWSSINNGIKQDSVINKQEIGTDVLFFNMHIEHEN